MKAMQALKEAATRSETPLTRIGPTFGKAPAYVSSICTRGSTPRTDTLAKMLDVCGFALCAIPKSEVPSSAIVIE